MSIIEDMTGIYIQSDFFDNAPTLEFFPASTSEKHYRMALLYGRNGSGKTTIAQGFREYKNYVETFTISLLPRKSGATIPVAAGTRGKFFVFDEEYVESRVKIEGDGMDAIVLFGEQIDLEERIIQTQRDIMAKQVEVDQQMAECSQFTDLSDITSPNYWISLITNELSKPDGWARIDSRIKGNVVRSSIPPAIDRIGQFTPDKPKEEIQGLFDERFRTFNTTGEGSVRISVPVTLIDINDSISDDYAKDLLEKAVPCPQWTERERMIFDLLGGRGLDNAKDFLSDVEQTVCDKCLQAISEEYRVKVLAELDHLLNREVEEFKGELKKMLIPETAKTAYEAYRELPSYSGLRDRLDDYNKAITTHNTTIQEKLDNPFEPMEYDVSIGVMEATEAVNQTLITLEAERCVYNDTIDKRSDVAGELISMNDALAHYAIKDLFDSLQRQRTAKAAADVRLQQRTTEIEALRTHKMQLDARRQNFELAAKDINHSLEYIFYCKERLELKLEADQKYHLKANGRSVNPKKVSCGERNALALSYFFTEIIKDMNANSGYSDEVFLVIDDPVSSFDFENRIGILSLLRWKLEQVLEGCATSKVLVMTHDIGTAFDIEKGLKEIRERFKRKKEEITLVNPRGEVALEEYNVVRLENRSVSPLRNIHKNEYSQLLARVYEYAKSGGDGLVIGNIMRRVLEAFSTFLYKCGISEITTRDNILAAIPERKREYFKSLMYKLVLDGESHLRERVQAMRDYDFSVYLSDEEKERTARDIICLMYLLNGNHILSYLPEAKADIDRWITNINSPIQTEDH